MPSITRTRSRVADSNGSFAPQQAVATRILYRCIVVDDLCPRASYRPRVTHLLRTLARSTYHCSLVREIHHTHSSGGNPLLWGLLLSAPTLPQLKRLATYPVELQSHAICRIPNSLEHVGLRIFPVDLNGRSLSQVTEWINFKALTRLELEASTQEFADLPTLNLQLMDIPHLKDLRLKDFHWRNNRPQIVHLLETFGKQLTTLHIFNKPDSGENSLDISAFCPNLETFAWNPLATSYRAVRPHCTHRSRKRLHYFLLGDPHEPYFDGKDLENVFHRYLGLDETLSEIRYLRPHKVVFAQDVSRGRLDTRATAQEIASVFACEGDGIAVEDREGFPVPPLVTPRPGLCEGGDRYHHHEHLRPRNDQIIQYDQVSVNETVITEGISSASLPTAFFFRLADHARLFPYFLFATSAISDEEVVDFHQTSDDYLADLLKAHLRLSTFKASCERVVAQEKAALESRRGSDIMATFRKRAFFLFSLPLPLCLGTRD